MLNFLVTEAFVYTGARRGALLGNVPFLAPKRYSSTPTAGYENNGLQEELILTHCIPKGTVAVWQCLARAYVRVGTVWQCLARAYVQLRFGSAWHGLMCGLELPLYANARRSSHIFSQTILIRIYTTAALPRASHFLRSVLPLRPPAEQV